VAPHIYNDSATHLYAIWTVRIFVDLFISSSNYNFIHTPLPVRCMVYEKIFMFSFNLFIQG